MAYSSKQYKIRPGGLANTPSKSSGLDADQQATDSQATHRDTRRMRAMEEGACRAYANEGASQLNLIIVSL